ncbi:metallophosphoesterase family protein [Oceanithermus sp.]|uniref:metallophosphoesterase family protein n=1 Tax=Oceanithermus sp. TaxID=2268145 RepID=UPI0025DA9301|nr:metallophosphoesterase family protein [Oceanithermus sp.]
MRLGLFSDVHANLPALEATLSALDSADVDMMLCLGDVVGYGPHPREVIALLRERKIVCTLGAADANLAFPFAKTEREGVAEETLRWTAEQLTDEEVRWLRSLPVTYRIRTPFGRLRAFHGLPYQPEKRMPLSAPTAELLPIFERLGSHVLACGGSHVPFHRRVGDRWLIDPGSVGMTLGGEPGADAMVLDITKAGIEVETLKIDYDLGQTVFDVQAWGLPDLVAEVIRNGGLNEEV